MKYILLTLFSLFTQFIKAQNERETIETAIKTTDFVFAYNRDNVIKQYGAGFENKFKAVIEELSPMINSADYYIRGGSNVAIVQFYNCPIQKERELDNTGPSKKINDYLLLMKVAVDKAFTMEEKIFDDTKGISALSYVDKAGGVHEYARTGFNNLYVYMAYYFGGDNPVYLEAVDRLLNHLIYTRIYLSKNQWNKDNRARYIDNYTDFSRVYSLVGCAYGRIDGLKTTDIRIVGFLYRSNKIAYDKLYIETTLDDSIVVDSQVVSCCGISAKWRDFYLNLTNVKYSYNYRVAFYTNKDRVRLAGKTFFIKKDYD